MTFSSLVELPEIEVNKSILKRMQLSVLGNNAEVM